jgi:quinol monooxygenase YgiN
MTSSLKGKLMSKLVFVRFLPRVGDEVQVEKILRTMVPQTRAEPGNRRYDLFSAEVDGRTLFHLIEQYENDEAVAHHRETEHYKAYRAQIMPLLEDPIAVTFLDPLDAENI